MAPACEVRHATDGPDRFNITSCEQRRRHAGCGRPLREGAIFTLTKWYLDGIDATGRVIIAYWARLAMGELRVTWHDLSEYDASAPARYAWSLAPVAPPRRVGDLLTWDSEALGSSIVMECADVPHELMLLDAPDGVVRWRGETMAARMRVERTGRESFEGVGYAECLTLTVPPWHLPIDTLEWGHWIAADRSRASTWFHWRGAHPLTCVVEDGRDATGALVDGTSVTTATATLEIAPARMLERRHLGEIVSPIPLLTRVVPDSLLALEETMWLGRGTRWDVGGATHEGWSVFETVHFRPSDA